MSWEHATFADGRELTIDIDPYMHREARVTIAGEPVQVRAVHRLRDGGTTILETSAGRITCPRRLGSSDRTPRIAEG